MSEKDWYESVSGDAILQGDILLRCPVFLLMGVAQWPLTAGAEMRVRAKVVDLVVMTQSCDLANDKVEEVLLARLIAWSDAVRNAVVKGNEAFRSRKFRKLLVEGNIPSLSLLHKREEEPRLPWSVVDFHHLFTLPQAFVRAFAAAQPNRLRLRSPYREHLAQAFARYFMRVGLPHDAKAFEKEGDVEV
jgi:hypothetical protein